MLPVAAAEKASGTSYLKVSTGRIRISPEGPNRK